MFELEDNTGTKKSESTPADSGQPSLRRERRFTGKKEVIRKSTSQAEMLISILPRASVWAVLIGAALSIWGYATKDRLPLSSHLEPQLLSEPIQEVLQASPFALSYGGAEYTVEPLARYEIAGVLVSHNDPIGWGDIYHDENSVDFQDLCLVWGSNLLNDNYRNLTYWSESWTCNFRTNSQSVYQKFDQAAISNNHLLASSEEVRKNVSEMRIGDQVYLRGMLVNYYPAGLPTYSRHSSLVRTDRGNGACEVMFVEVANIIKTGSREGYNTYMAGIAMVLAGALGYAAGLLFVPYRLWIGRKAG